jgi:surface antigen
MKLLFAGLFVAIALPAAIAAPTVAISTAPRPAPAAPLFASVPIGGFPDRFPYGQCTWWAAYNRQVTWSGDAGQWLLNAREQGVETSGLPSLGAIVVYKPGSGYSGYGHVAIVIAVSPSTYAVSEMNYLGWGEVNTRSVAWPDSHVSGFIPLSGGAP